MQWQWIECDSLESIRGDVLQEEQLKERESERERERERERESEREREREREREIGREKAHCHQIRSNIPYLNFFSYFKTRLNFTFIRYPFVRPRHYMIIT